MTWTPGVTALGLKFEETPWGDGRLSRVDCGDDWFVILWRGDAYPKDRKWSHADIEIPGVRIPKGQLDAWMSGL